MGAQFDSTVIEAKDKSEAYDAYSEVKAARAWEYGHGGYTGTFAEAGFGLTFQTGTWTLEKALEHCEDNHPKWEAAWAYDIGDGKWFVGAWCSS